MKVDSGLSRLWEGLGFSADRAGKAGKASKTAPSSQEEALELVQEAKESANRTTMRTWDKHNDMVEKSQELRETRQRQEATARRNRERQEEHSDLLARMALENANRAQMLEDAALKRRDEAAAAN